MEGQHRSRSRASQRSVASRASRTSHTSRLSRRSQRSQGSQTLQGYPTNQSSTPSLNIIPPSPAPYFSYYHEYLKAVIGIAVLGGQITFTLIVSEIADPARLKPSLDDTPQPTTKSVFQRETVRLLIALSWLCFTLALGLAIFALLQSSHRISRGDPLPHVTSFFYVWIDSVIRALNLLPLVAFFLLSLAAAAYVPIVGWIAVGSIVFYTVAVHVYWWVDAWRYERKAEGNEEGDEELDGVGVGVGVVTPVRSRAG